MIYLSFNPSKDTQKLVALMQRVRKWKTGGKYLSVLISRVLLYRYGVHVSRLATIGSNINFPHPTGIVIGDNVIIGDNVTIYQHVTIGQKKRGSGYPVINDNVTIYTGSIVVGAITIGKGATIGAQNLVKQDVAENTFVSVLKRS